MSDPTSPAKPIAEKISETVTGAASSVRQSFSALTQNEAMVQAAEDFRRQSTENVKVGRRQRKPHVCNVASICTFAGYDR